MYLNKIGEAISNFKLLEILNCVKEDVGFDFKLDLKEKDRVGVYFTFGYKEHYMFLDGIIFDNDLEEWDKVEIITDELIYYFDVPRDPWDVFEATVAKEFSLHEADDDEEVKVELILYDKDNGVNVVLINKETGERREFDEWYVYVDITHVNAKELGYKVAHSMLDDYWGK